MRWMGIELSVVWVLLRTTFMAERMIAVTEDIGHGDNAKAIMIGKEITPCVRDCLLRSVML